MNTNQKQESVELKQKIQDKKNSTWEHMRDISCATPEHLRNCGYGSLSHGAALEKIFDRACGEIEKLIQEHEKKHP